MLFKFKYSNNDTIPAFPLAMVTRVRQTSGPFGIITNTVLGSIVLRGYERVAQIVIRRVVNRGCCV